MLIRVYGVVQGVGFRPFIARLAREYGFRGYVRNRGSYVEIFIDVGRGGRAYEFITDIKRKAPTNAVIESIDVVEDVGDTNSYEDFRIIKSMDDVRNSAYPPDLALCPECLRDLFTPGNRRYMYPFTNCTNCGARFSVIKALPYDRINTTMAPFTMCPSCQKEYESIDDRRYDAQTISCPECGPEVALYDRNARVVDRGLEAIRACSKAIDDGNFVVIKSWGGMHIAANIMVADVFRRWYKRGEKPFAIMVRDIDCVRAIARVSKMEEMLLTSPQRPIVLLDKGRGPLRGILEHISPKLHNVGVFLPYTPLHYLLFHYMEADAVIMTSANVPGKPMIIGNKEAFKLGAHYYLLHDRDIAMRSDDSLLRVNAGRVNYIRRSRGVVPRYIPLSPGLKGPVVCVGSELNNVGAIGFDSKIYPTQYIGDCEDLDVLSYLDEALRHLIGIFDLKEVRSVGVDMHPQYSTRHLANDIAMEYGADVYECQHHHAHALSLMLEHKLNTGVFLTLDGVGYGPDGTVWGGEVLYCSDDTYRRVGHLRAVPMPGGDMAAKDAARMLYSYASLAGAPELGHEYFSAREIKIMDKLMQRSVKTSSMGRFLDTLSLYLDGNRYRTYEGEGAMKLERLLVKRGVPPLYIEPVIKETSNAMVLDQVLIFRDVLQECSGQADGNRVGAAKGAVKAVIEGLMDIASKAGEEFGTRNVGLSGGVAYNRYVTRAFIKSAKSRGMRPYIHNRVPPGDGGIAIGQALYIARSKSERG